MSDVESQRAANLALARSAFEDFEPTSPAWQAGLADDVVMTFPYADSIGLPPVVEGKEAAVGLFIGVAEKLNLKFHDVRLQSMADPEWVLVETRGKGSFKGNAYNQQYITLVQFRDGQMKQYREYFDCQVVVDCFGSIEKLMAG